MKNIIENLVDGIQGNEDLDINSRLRKYGKWLIISSVILFLFSKDLFIIKSVNLDFIKFNSYEKNQILYLVLVVIIYFLIQYILLFRVVFSQIVILRNQQYQAALFNEHQSSLQKELELVMQRFRENLQENVGVLFKENEKANMYQELSKEINTILYGLLHKIGISSDGTAPTQINTKYLIFSDCLRISIPIILACFSVVSYFEM